MSGQFFKINYKKLESKWQIEGEALLTLKAYEWKHPRKCPDNGLQILWPFGNGGRWATISKSSFFMDNSSRQVATPFVITCAIVGSGIFFSQYAVAKAASTAPRFRIPVELRTHSEKHCQRFIHCFGLLSAYQFILTQPVGKEYSPDRRRILSPCCNLHFALTSKFIIESKLQQSSGSMCIGIFSGEHLIENSLWTVDNRNIIVTTRDTSFSNMLNQRLTTSDRCILSGRVEI